ncbi:helix-turn-helix transcriptional regulator [Kribbella sp. NBC_00382]|uniref:winged helix-turn-helix transcriptional regulator n=1 Tax=Kribbella sp. NBC_00382 TaxID=2975967 RepID=UPI002E1B6586
MHVQLEGRLAERGQQPLGDYCPIDLAMQAIGQRSTILLLREAYYGVTRFDDFAARTGLTEATTAGRLKALVELGVLAKTEYQEPGKRRRHEYRLTESGQDLMPVVFGLAQWSNRHHAPPEPLELAHDGHPVEIVARCTKGHLPKLDELTITV